MAATALADVIQQDLSDDEHSKFLPKITARLNCERPRETPLAVICLVAEVLKSASTNDRVSIDVRRQLIRFLCAAIESYVSDEDVESLRQVLELCQEHEWICENLLCLIDHSLTSHIEKSFQRPPSGASSSATANFRDLFQRIQKFYPFRENLVQEELICPVYTCVVFMKLLCRCSKSNTPYYSDRFFTFLWIISISDDAKLAHIAKRSSLAVIDSFRNHEIEQLDSAGDTREDIWQYMWTSIVDAASNPSNRLSYHALTVWLKLLDATANWSPTFKCFLYGSEYWTRIQNQLAIGSQDCRKLSLSILSVSLAQISEDIETPFKFIVTERVSYERQFSRYITLFETIVLGRYLNQIKECLGDLEFLVSKSSKVDEFFVFALLSAALSNSMQESIRGFIGDWILQHGAALLAHLASRLPNFMAQSFLAWALQGHLCVAGTQISASNQPYSSHGEKLSRFLRDMLRSRSNEEERYQLISKMLNYIGGCGKYIFPYSRSYALQGILGGLDGGHTHLSVDDTSAVMAIFDAANSCPEIVRDLTIVQCFTLMSFCDAESLSRSSINPLLDAHSLLLARRDSTEDNYRNALKNFFGQDCIVTASYKHYANEYVPAPVEVIAGAIIETNARCLQAQHLQEAIRCLDYAMEMTANEPSASHLELTLKSVWEETEVQDYPRRIMMALPMILLHPKTVELCFTSPALKALITECVRKIQGLGEHRVYIFSSLAVSMRRLIFSGQGAGQFLWGDFVTSYVVTPARAKVEFYLETTMAIELEALVPNIRYEMYYGPKEGYAHALVFDMLNRLPDEYLEEAHHALDQLLKPWIDQPLPVPAFSLSKNSLQLQVILVLFEKLSAQHSQSRIQYYITVLQDLLALEPLPRFRFLLEWILARLYVRNPALRVQVLHTLSSLDERNPKHSVSILKIAVMVSRLPDTGESFSAELIAQTALMCTSAKIAIRHEAQWVFPTLWSHILEKNWSSISQNPAYARLNSKIRSLDAFKDPPPRRLLEQFDLVRNHTLTDLFQGAYLEMEPSEAEMITREDFVLLEKSSSGCTFSGRPSLPALPLGTSRLRKPNQSQNGPVYNSVKNSSLEAASVMLPLQTKSIRGFETEDFSNLPCRKQHLVIIASLLDNPYNLGGISRVGEVFGIDSLFVRNLGLTKSKEFISTAVSSHLHLPIEQLDLPDISQFLQERRLNGWTIVAIEQTDSGKVLGEPDCLLPEKTVLVIGGEKRGIPGNLLSEMDICVEIKQYGLTRSLNVQTAASIVLYEYSKQHPQLRRGTTL